MGASRLHGTQLLCSRVQPVALELRYFLVGAALLAAVGCTDPFAPKTPASSVEEICAASSNWLPTTPSVDLFKPAPHPAGDCPFYRASWQNFLIATQPDPTTGQPALQSYATIDDLFQRTIPRPQPRSWLGDVKQAGARQILIDQTGHAIYYSIVVNQGFADFVADNDLQTAAAIRAAPDNLFFPGNVVELKSAWQEIADDDPSVATYITTHTLVSRLSMVDGKLVEDHENPRDVTVRLLALHVAFTLPGHPELVWSTFEHSEGASDLSAEDGKRDVAPIAADAANPSLIDPNNLQDTTVVSSKDYVLYKAGTAANAANQAIAESELSFAADSQSFPGEQTSIYRMFPASKSNSAHPDDAITSINFNVQTLFQRAHSQLSVADKRGYYRLVGAVWMDKPEYFATDATLENGSDSDDSLLGGEDRLSSVAMESFTQAPDAFPNCFSCHNTQSVTEKGVPIDRDRQGTPLMDPKQINVSHVFSQFLLDEAQAQTRQ